MISAYTAGAGVRARQRVVQDEDAGVGSSGGRSTRPAIDAAKRTGTETKKGRPRSSNGSTGEMNNKAMQELLNKTKKENNGKKKEGRTCRDGSLRQNPD